MDNKELKQRDIHLVSVVLDAVGAEASLGCEAWERVSRLDLTTSDGLRVLVKEYVVPDFISSPALFRKQALESLQRLLTAEGDDPLETQIVRECPYMERTPPRLLFTILAEELSQGETNI